MEEHLHIDFGVISDETHKNIRVLSISETDFPGMSNALHIKTNLNNFFMDSSLSKPLSFPRRQESSSFLKLDKFSFNKIENLIKKYPNSEPSFFYHLSKTINEKSNVFLGNSMPIRYWDMMATYRNKNLKISASRGLNGIDGQISTFLGWANETSEQNWGIFGDLTALYDLASLWMLQHRENLNANIVIINNQGGKIFNKILDGKWKSFSLNTHNINFRHFAKMWKLNYKKIVNFSQIKSIPRTGHNVIEIIPNDHETDQFLSSLTLI